MSAWPRPIAEEVNRTSAGWNDLEGVYRCLVQIDGMWGNAPEEPIANAPDLYDAFDDWKRSLGIRYFSTREIVTPNHEAIAVELGYKHLVPPPHLWPWTALVLRVCDLVREAVRAPVAMRNLWRPRSYNTAVKGSAGSDHLDACAADLDFRTPEDRHTAEGALRLLDLSAPELELSLGLGATSIHVGTQSSKGRRHWYYKSYPDAEKRPFPEVA